MRVCVCVCVCVCVLGCMWKTWTIHTYSWYGCLVHSSVNSIGINKEQGVLMDECLAREVEQIVCKLWEVR